MVKKCEDMNDSLDRIPACDGRTDRGTDASCHGIVRAMHTRRAGKTDFYIYRVGQIKRGQCSFFRRSKARFRKF